jgi:hypothetical protein
MGLAGQERKTARAVVDKIVDDITDRSGLGNAWEGIDADVREEIRKTWTDIVEDALWEGQ